MSAGRVFGAVRSVRPRSEHSESMSTLNPRKTIIWIEVNSYLLFFGTNYGQRASAAARNSRGIAKEVEFFECMRWVVRRVTVMAHDKKMKEKQNKLLRQPYILWCLRFRYISYGATSLHIWQFTAWRQLACFISPKNVCWHYIFHFFHCFISRFSYDELRRVVRMMLSLHQCERDFVFFVSSFLFLFRSTQVFSLCRCRFVLAKSLFCPFFYLLAHISRQFTPSQCRENYSRKIVLLSPFAGVAVPSSHNARRYTANVGVWRGAACVCLVTFSVWSMMSTSYEYMDMLMPTSSPTANALTMSINCMRWTKRNEQTTAKNTEFFLFRCCCTSFEVDVRAASGKHVFTMTISLFHSNGTSFCYCVQGTGSRYTRFPFIAEPKWENENFRTLSECIHITHTHNTNANTLPLQQCEMETCLAYDTVPIAEYHLIDRTCCYYAASNDCASYSHSLQSFESTNNGISLQLTHIATRALCYTSARSVCASV